MSSLGHLNFYSDIMRYHETLPCCHHPLAYASLVEAELVANAELIGVRRKYGDSTGYVILDQSGIEVCSSKGLWNNA